METRLRAPRREREKNTHLDDLLAKEDEVVDRVLLGHVELCVLEQPPAVLVRHAVLVHDVQGNDPDLVQTAVIKRKEKGKVLSAEPPRGWSSRREGKGRT